MEGEFRWRGSFFVLGHTKVAICTFTQMGEICWFCILDVTGGENFITVDVLIKFHCI